MAEHINEIVKLPIDLGCINDQLVKKIAEIIDVERLELI